MDRIFAIARRDYMVNFRRGGFQFWTWLVPVLGALALIAASIFSTQVEEFFDRQAGPGAQVEHVGLVDESGLFTPVLAPFEENFIVFAAAGEAKEALAADQVEVVLYIPADYLATGVIRAEDPDASFGITRLSHERIRAFVTAHLVAGQGIDPAIESRLVQPFALVPEGTEEEAATDPVDFIDGFAPFFIGILFAMAIFTGSGYMLGGVTEEKNSRIMEVLVSSVTPQQLLMGKILGLGALSLTQLAVWVGSIMTLGSIAPSVIEAAPDISSFLVDQTRVWIFGAVFFLLGVLVYNTIFATIGALTHSVEESQTAGAVASLIAVIPFIFGGYTFVQPHGLYSQIMSYFPLTSPVMMLIRVGTPDLPNVELAAALIVMVIAAAGIFWLGGRFFARGLLMYSRRPSLMELLKGN